MDTTAYPDLSFPVDDDAPSAGHQPHFRFQYPALQPDAQVGASGGKDGLSPVERALARFLVTPGLFGYAGVNSKADDLGPREGADSRHSHSGDFHRVG